MELHDVSGFSVYFGALQTVYIRPSFWAWGRDYTYIYRCQLFFMCVEKIGEPGDEVRYIVHVKAYLTQSV